MFIQMFGQTAFLVRHNKMGPVVLYIVFLHCVIWWLLYFGKKAVESHFPVKDQRKGISINAVWFPFSHVGGVSLYFCPDWNIFTTMEWMIMKFCTDIHGLQRMDPMDLGDPLTLPLVPPQSLHLWFWAKLGGLTWKIGTDNHVPLRVNCRNFAEPLTPHLVIKILICPKLSKYLQN